MTLLAALGSMAAWQAWQGGGPPARLPDLGESPTLGSDSPNPQKVSPFCVVLLALIGRPRRFSDCVFSAVSRSTAASPVLFSLPPPQLQSASVRLPRSRKPTHPPICCSLDVLICRVPGPNTQPATFTSTCFLLPPPPPPPSFEIPTRHSDPVKPRRCSRQP